MPAIIVLHVLKYILFIIHSCCTKHANRFGFSRRLNGLPKVLKSTVKFCLPCPFSSQL